MTQEDPGLVQKIEKMVSRERGPGVGEVPYLKVALEASPPWEAFPEPGSPLLTKGD